MKIEVNRQTVWHYNKTMTYIVNKRKTSTRFVPIKLLTATKVFIQIKMATETRDQEKRNYISEMIFSH